MRVYLKNNLQQRGLGVAQVVEACLAIMSLCFQAPVLQKKKKKK
jgi:hypothetical protein